MSFGFIHLCRYSKGLLKCYHIIIVLVLTISISFFVSLILRDKFPPTITSSYKDFFEVDSQLNRKINALKSLKNHIGFNRELNYYLPSLRIDTSQTKNVKVNSVKPKNKDDEMLTNGYYYTSDCDYTENFKLYEKPFITMTVRIDSNNTTRLQAESLLELRSYARNIESIMSSNETDLTEIQTCSLTDTLIDFLKTNRRLPIKQQITKSQLLSELETCLSEIHSQNNHNKSCSKMKSFLKAFFNYNQQTDKTTLIYINALNATTTPGKYCNMNLFKLNKNSSFSNHKILNYTFNDENIDFKCSTLNTLTREWYLIVTAIIIKLVLTILYLQEIFFLLITLAMILLIILNSYFFYEFLFTESLFTVFNLLIVGLLLIINTSDTYIWSLCYIIKKQKTTTAISSSPQQGAEAATASSTATTPLTLDKILNDIIINVFYYLLPKSLLFVVYLAIVYVNTKISFMKYYSAYGLIVFVLYFLLIILFYSTVFILILKCNFIKYFKYVNINLKAKSKFIDKLNGLFIKFLTNNLTDFILKFRVLWFVLFTCTSIASVLSIFYAPKLHIDTNIYRLNKPLNGWWEKDSSRVSGAVKENVSFYIVWGLDYEKNFDVGKKTVLMNNEMIKTYYEQYKSVEAFCDYLANQVKNQVIDNEIDYKLDDYYHYHSYKTLRINKFDCFSSRLENYLSRKHRTQVYSASLTRDQYCKMISIDNLKLLSNDTELFKKMYAKCILIWSTRMYHERQMNDSYNEDYTQSQQLKEGALFYANTTLPSLYVIKIEADVKLTLNFLNMQAIYNAIDVWWKNTTKNLNLTKPRNSIWWTSEVFERYAKQYELNKTLMINSFTPFLFIFLCVFLTTTNFFTSVYVCLTIFLILASTIASTVWLEWRIDVLTCILYVFVLFISTHYCMLYAMSYRFTLHLSNLNRLIWSIRSIGATLLLTTVNYTLSSIPLLFSSVPVLQKTGVIIILSSIISYLYSTFFLQSLLGIKNTFEYHYRFKRPKASRSNDNINNESPNNADDKSKAQKHRKSNGNSHSKSSHSKQRTSNSSFSPSTYIATCSSYIEADSSTVNECRNAKMMQLPSNGTINASSNQCLLSTKKTSQNSNKPTNTINAKFLEIKNFNSSIFNPNFLMPNVYNSSIQNRSLQRNTPSNSSSYYQSDDSNSNLANSTVTMKSVISKSQSVTSTCI